LFPFDRSQFMQATYTLSKTRLLAYRQCERRLWLEIHRRDLIEISAQQQARFDAGHFELRLPYVDDTELVMDVLRQGDQVQVREPLALEAAVQARLTDAAAQYNKCAGPVSPPTAS